MGLCEALNAQSPVKVKCVLEGVEMNTVVTKLIEQYVKETKPKKQK
jgi:hypothetical protein